MCVSVFLFVCVGGKHTGRLTAGTGGRSGAALCHPCTEDSAARWFQVGPGCRLGGGGRAARILALPSSNCMTSGKLRISLCLSFLIFANDCGGTGDRLTGLSRLEGLALRLAVSRVRSWRCEFAGAVRAAFCPSSLLVPRSRNGLVWSGAPSSLISVVSSADMDVVARDRRPMVHQGSFQNKDWDVLSFPGRPHKLPQTWWLKATEVGSLAVLEPK